MTLRLKFWAFGALAAVVLVGDYSGAIAKEKSVCEALKAIDPDNDGTVDLNEAKKAASALFDKLDTDPPLSLASRPPMSMGKARSIAMRPRVMPAGL